MTTPLEPIDRPSIARRVGADGQVTWIAEVSRNKLRAKKNFSARKFGGEEPALQAAHAWREVTLQEMQRLDGVHGSSARAIRTSLASALSRPHRALTALHETSSTAGVTCLDTEWHGAQHAYRFRCPQGHEWQRTGAVQRTNPRCPSCSRAQAGAAGRKTDNLGKLRAVALERGGECLSPVYDGARARYRFRCAAGHEWDAHGYNVLAGNWCRPCAVQALVGPTQGADSPRPCSPCAPLGRWAAAADASR